MSTITAGLERHCEHSRMSSHAACSFRSSDQSGAALQSLFFLFVCQLQRKKRTTSAEHLGDQKEFKYLNQTVITARPLQVYCVNFFTVYRRRCAFSITLDKGGGKNSRKKVLMPELNCVSRPRVIQGNIRRDSPVSQSVRCLGRENQSV